MQRAPDVDQQNRHLPCVVRGLELRQRFLVKLLLIELERFVVMLSTDVVFGTRVFGSDLVLGTRRLRRCTTG